MLDVGQFVRNNRRDFARFEPLQKARGDRDRGILRVPTGGEGVGLVGVDEIDFWHRDAGIARQPFDGPVEVGRLPRVDLLGVLHAQHQLVGVPVAEEVGDHGKAERQHHASGAANEVTHDHEDAREGSQQNPSSQRVEHVCAR